jgi:adenylate cyclase
MNLERPQFEDDLYFEIFKSERLRVRGLMIVMGVVTVALLAVRVALPRAWNPFVQLFGDDFPTGAIAAITGAAFCYELIVHGLTDMIIARRMHVPELGRYGNALAETSLPTIVLLVVSRVIPPEVALNSPVAMVYFLFISLSTLP